MQPAQRLRASDAEREATAVVLRTATAEGRLTLEEFGERSRHAYASSTRDDLAALVADLPVRPMDWTLPLPPLSPRSRHTSQLSLIALVFGLMSLPSIGWMPFGGAAAVLGIVLGARSLRQIGPGASGSRTMARAGVLCGSIGLVLQVAFLILLPALSG